MCVVCGRVACMCATAVGVGMLRLMRRRPDRGAEPAERPLTLEVLVELAAAVAAIGGGREES
jgi:hypothetical protein